MLLRIKSLLKNVIARKKVVMYIEPQGNRCRVRFKVRRLGVHKGIKKNEWYEGYIKLGTDNTVYTGEGIEDYGEQYKELWLDWDCIVYDLKN